MEYVVYIIKSLNKNFTYVGMTNNIRRRLDEHNSGRTKSTKNYAPFKMIYQEKVEDSKKGRIRELFLKSGQGRKWIKENYS